MRRDDVEPALGGELDRQAPHPAGRPEDDDRPAGRDVEALQRLPRRQPGERQAAAAAVTGTPDGRRATI